MGTPLTASLTRVESPGETGTSADFVLPSVEEM